MVFVLNYANCDSPTYFLWMKALFLSLSFSRRYHHQYRNHYCYHQQQCAYLRVRCQYVERIHTLPIVYILSSRCMALVSLMSRSFCIIIVKNINYGGDLKTYYFTLNDCNMHRSMTKLKVICLLFYFRVFGQRMRTHFIYKCRSSQLESPNSTSYLINIRLSFSFRFIN